MKTIIFDLDGTLANIDHRIHHVRNGNRRWKEFFAECVNDTPVKNIVLLNRMLWVPRACDGHLKIIIVSGRSDEVRIETEEWLKKHSVYYHELIMRKAGDYTPDDKLKEGILDTLLNSGHNILFTVDDRQRVVDMWRRRGITCLQAAAWEEKGVAKPTRKGLLTLMVGPSGAGKSSWLNKDQFLEESEHHWVQPRYYSIERSHVLSSDQIRHDLCGDFRDQSQNELVFAALHKVAKARIGSGLPTVIDATHLKRKDRLASVALAEGSPVRYIVIDRPLSEKMRDAGWRKEVIINDVSLVVKHHQTFQTNLKDILSGDGQPNIEVIDLRKV